MPTTNSNILQSQSRECNKTRQHRGKHIMETTIQAAKTKRNDKPKSKTTVVQRPRDINNGMEENKPGATRIEESPEMYIQGKKTIDYAFGTEEVRNNP
eukprot:10231891-Ditylum_brightwellii.AAC.1